MAISSRWSQPLGEAFTGTAGVNLSKEYDYLSLAMLQGDQAGQFLDAQGVTYKLPR